MATISIKPLSCFGFAFVADALKYNERKNPEIDRTILYLIRTNSFVVSHFNPEGIALTAFLFAFNLSLMCCFCLIFGFDSKAQ